MNCNCKKEFEEKVVNQMEWKGKKIVSAELQGMLVFGKTSDLFTTSTVTVRLEGQKKEVEIEVKHSFCPFCGVKTEKEKEISEPEK